MDSKDINLKENFNTNKVDNKEKKTKKKKTKTKKKNVCSFEGCKKKLQIHEITIKCSNCNCSYCPKHRTKENHKCKDLNNESIKKEYLNTQGLGGGKFTKLIKI